MTPTLRRAEAKLDHPREIRNRLFVEARSPRKGNNATVWVIPICRV
jgi:hypothetical protein